MLLGDKDVGNGALVGHLLEGILNGGAIICEKEGSVSIPWWRYGTHIEIFVETYRLGPAR